MKKQYFAVKWAGTIRLTSDKVFTEDEAKRHCFGGIYRDMEVRAMGAVRPSLRSNLSKAKWDTYKIVRTYDNADYEEEILYQGLTIEAAKLWLANQPESKLRSEFADDPEDIERTKLRGIWWLGYRKESNEKAK